MEKKIETGKKQEELKDHKIDDELLDEVSGGEGILTGGEPSIDDAKKYHGGLIK